MKQWFCKNDTSKDAVIRFYKRILLKYEENVDYKEIDKTDPLMSLYKNISKFLPALVVVGNPKDNRSSHNAKYYAVTGECFKLICLTKNPEIRQYYVQIEHIYIMYMKYQCQYYEMNFPEQVSKLCDLPQNIKYRRLEQIKKLEEELRKRHRVGCIYYIRCNNYIKIGYTYNLPHRLSVLQTGSPYELSVIKTELCQFPECREKELHKIHKSLHIKGEWFLDSIFD